METTPEILTELIKSLNEQYVVQLDALPFKPKVRDALKDGFSDGVRAGVMHTVKMLGVTIKK